MNETISEGLVNIVRGFTRPALSVTGLVGLIVMYQAGYGPPLEYKVLVFGMIGWWFGDRSISKIGASILGKDRSNVW